MGPKPFGKVRVGDKVATEREEIGVACRNDGRGTLTSKTAGCDQGAAEFLPQMLRGDRSLAFVDLLDALDARLDHVKVGDAQPIELGHPRSVIYCRSDRSRPIDTWSTSVQIPPRLTWICGTGQARRRWRDRSAPPRGRHQGSSSGAGTPHRLARWPASGDAG